VKITIIGGSAFSTPCLIKFLDQENSPGMEVVLASRSRRKLDAVTVASKLLVAGDIAIRAQEIRDNTWEQILDGSDCVLIQIRVGGYEGRLFDETFPHKYGLCGDEGLGAGGLSAGWRTWPVVSGILESIEKFSPSAFVIMLTSPLSLLVRAAVVHTHMNVVGICELPWTTLQNVCRLAGRQTRDVQSDYFGVNHLGWFFNIRSRSEDLIEELASKANERSFPTAKFLRSHRCLPTRYLMLHYEPEQVLIEQMSHKTPRAEMLSNLQAEAYRAYERGDVRDVASVLEQRAALWYSQAVGPLLVAMGGQRTEIPFFLSTPHGSYTSLFEPSDVVETAHKWVGGRLLRSPLAAVLPEHVFEHLLPLVRFERTATEAITSRKFPLLIEALSLHPWIHENIHLESVANEIAAHNDTFLSHQLKDPDES
jgi:6-phospho-beta-glucosidase